jgi:hypothetical protein
VANGASTSDPGLLPAWARVCGWLFLLGQTLFISRIVYESTVLTCVDGPQMVGFSMAHGGHSFFLLGLLFLPFGALFFLVALVFGVVKKLRFNGREWALMAALFVSFSFLFVPYRVWEHLDMTVCSSGPLGDAFLLEAARLGDLGQVTRLVAEGHSVNRDSGSDDTPLSSAIKGRKADVVAFLLSKGANVNAHNSLTGETPLMRAAYSEDTQMLELLIAQGADPCAINNKWDQENAQRIAEKKHNPVAAEYLTAHSHCSLPPRLPASCANESAATCVEVH